MYTAAQGWGMWGGALHSLSADLSAAVAHFAHVFGQLALICFPNVEWSQ